MNDFELNVSTFFPIIEIKEINSDSDIIPFKYDFLIIFNINSNVSIEQMLLFETKSSIVIELESFFVSFLQA